MCFHSTSHPPSNSIVVWDSQSGVSVLAALSITVDRDNTKDLDSLIHVHFKYQYHHLFHNFKFISYELLADKFVARYQLSYY